jgi:predicted adenine nucleotide alpha hydrolase (AANH) superfamily ATPase
MTVLLHLCCGPCLLGIARRLEENGQQFRGYFYNPNIHPLIEFRRRLKAVKMLKFEWGYPIRIEEDYGLRPFLRRVVPVENDRCRHCYRMRLEQTARVAKQERFDAFSTTLLGSPDQDHELVRETGETLAQELGVPFFYRDWRGLYPGGHEEARRKRLYLQSYCGCIYSEYERFEGTTRHLYRKAGASPQASSEG